ncbi:Mov34/MPN/PAD-1 family protein [Klebsiella pneumoniae]|uniref:Mov34/MPN/PAD-1 family protein n=1 Tax=Klebsiella pneumoniae TaxID=573 RepID=UPI001CF0EADA|nr:Mov34/MPN/PAD-1 family protein [Klebsiella pneumoniae]MCA6702548.1 Mov34/MPN/PAD-1 family protein [Klebsiella pneumoniae]
MLRIIESGQLIWNIEGIATGCLSKKVITHLLNFVQKGRYAHESGGVLLGYIDSDTNGLLVENATFPGSGDCSSRTSFYRSSRHQEDAESWISLTNGKGTHLVLWHTHPELTPTPSDIDMADYNNVIKNATLNSGLIYIIIGTQELKIWYGIKPCQLIPVGTISLDKL